MKVLRKFLRYGVYTVITVLGIVVVAILVFPYRWLGEQIFQEVHQLHQADAIVVLFGDGNGKGTWVGPESHRRVVYGVKLFQEGYAKKIIFSGGYPGGANLMAKFGAQLGISPQDMIVENRSRDTISNWDQTARIVKAQQWTSILLVSSASHVARAIPYARRELMRSLFHDFGAYVLYVVAGKQTYERIVDYVRKDR
jgi:uncharacterized SAM-binding protein YcdF (DUF218 family)